MANNPKQIQDPTEAALSAIQDALNLRDAEAAAGTAEATEPDAAEREARRRQGRAAGVDDDLFFDGVAPAVEAPLPEPQRRAANDDRRSVGQILQSLQRRPSRAPFVAAGLFSVAWVVTGAVIALAYFGTDVGRVLGQGGGAPLFFIMLAAIGMPVLLAFVLAHLLWRAQELRVIGRSMADVVMRLAEPETIASESVVTVGQAIRREVAAIRREVAAMGDGVERALARAAELEALVHNEVAALERAYNDNELRIRGLIEDLASQRDALVGQADQVRSAISGVHIGLTQDITSVSEMVAASVNDAAQRITRTLAEKGEHITLALGRAGDSMIDAIGERGGDLLENLNRTGAEVTRTLESASEKMTASLNVKTEDINTQVADLTGKLADMLTTRLDNVTEGLTQRALTVADQLAQRT
jgi:hypothetical protein